MSGIPVFLFHFINKSNRFLFACLPDAQFAINRDFFQQFRPRHRHILFSSLMAPDLFLRSDSVLYHYDSSIIMYTLLFSVSKYYHEINIKCNTQRNQYFHFFFIMTHLFDIIHRRWFLTFDQKETYYMNYGKKGSKKRQAELTSKGIMYGKKMRVIFCKVLLVCCLQLQL